MMLLHTGKLYWPGTYEQTPAFPMLQEDIQCDVLIVGGGISGVFSAYFLAESGLDVVLIDKQKAGGGSTSANTGLLQFSNDKTLTSCIHSFGEEAGVRHYKLCEQAIEHIKKLSQTLAVNPDFIERSSLYMASSPADEELLKEEYASLRQHGFAAEYWSQNQIKEKYGFEKAAAIYTKGDAEVNPYKFTHGLLQKAVANGLRVYEGTRVAGTTFAQNHVNILTDTNHTICAREVIFAAGYEAQSIRKDSNAALSSSFAIVTAPAADFTGWHQQSLIWETARPYLYLRTTTEGRIIIGGLDEKRYDKETMESSLIAKRDELLMKLSNLFPQYEGIEAEYFWAGVFGSTHDGLPIVGMYEEYPRCRFLLGYGGNGLIYSAMLGNMLREALTTGNDSTLAMYSDKRPLFQT
jgi:glycine/D-amino acid oxidase-like deaminating enzyme